MKGRTSAKSALKVGVIALAAVAAASYLKGKNVPVFKSLPGIGG